MINTVHDLDLNLQVYGGELKHHLRYQMKHLWHWNLKLEDLRVLQELWFIARSFGIG